MGFGDYVILTILVLVVLLVFAAWLYPRIRKYRLVIKRLEPKKRRAKPSKKKRKAIVIKLI